MVGAAEKQLTTLTFWYLSDKYDENQLRAVADIPYTTLTRV